jgi:hypothetical protein
LTREKRIECSRHGGAPGPQPIGLRKWQIGCGKCAA